HHTWYHLHWLQSRIKEASDDLSKETFLKDREFKIRFKTSAKDHTFIREIGHTFTGTSKINKDIRKPIIKEEQYELTAGPIRRRLYLALYDVGQDEASTGWFHGSQNNFEYQGVLIVRVMLGISVNGTVADWYNPKLRSSVLGTALNGLRAAWVKLGETYRLTTNVDKKIKNIYVHFLPGILMQGKTGGKENYKLKYLKPPTVQLGNHPDASKVTAAELTKLNKKLIYDKPNKKLSYKQKMTIAERFQLHKMFSVEADRQKVTQLYTLTQALPAGIVNNNSEIDVAINITPEDLKLHFLNMNKGDDEKTKLAFLKTWVDAKLGYAFTLEKITP
ncbi:MAG: hypothetical protein U9R56_06735, partial [candidate division Zixibacteria bacterium]|nr:hypothetical protein [candidate division Zixibacteria bacterium]